MTIRVDSCTITNWEKNRCHPRLYLVPTIVRFLGYNPFLVNESGEMGPKIRAYRKSIGITQKDLAKELGVDPTTLARWERGQANTKGERTKEAVAQLFLILSQTE